MKKNPKNFWLAILAFISMIGLVACGGDDAAPSNQIKLDGKTIKFAEAYVNSELDIENEFGEYSYHTFFLTSDGLSVSETGSLSGSGDLLIQRFYKNF